MISMILDIQLLASMFADNLLMYVDQLLTMGLPLIDKNLGELVNAMKTGPDAGAGDLILGWAKSIGASLALGVGAYEAWMMILGRRGIDAMKILRIIIICVCIGNAKGIIAMCNVPGDKLETLTRAKAAEKNDEVALKEKMVADYQTHYIDSLRSKLSKLDEKAAAERERQYQEASDDMGFWEKLKTQFNNWKDSQLDKFNSWSKATAATVETKVAELANDIIRFIGELIFQMIYYGMLLGRSIFLNVLGMFMPIAFAMSLAPPFKSAWSQWLSKYLSITLWGFLVYMIVYYVDYILLFYLQQDLDAYKGLLGSKELGSWDQIGTLGIQAIGTTCMYVVGLLAGAKILAMVPEVSSWLIPGGVSSSIGQASAGVAAAAGGFAGSAAGGAVKTAGSAVAGGAGVAARAAAGAIGGAIQGASSTGAGAQAGRSTLGGNMGSAIGRMAGGVAGAFQGAASSVGNDVKSAVSGGGRGSAFSKGKEAAGGSGKPMSSSDMKMAQLHHDINGLRNDLNEKK